MRSIRALTLWLTLLLLVPATALAVLGWRSVGDVDAAFAVRARSDLDEAQNGATTALFRRSASWKTDLQEAADAAADRVRAAAPYETVHVALARAEAELVQRGLRAPGRLRLVDPEGRGIFPVERAGDSGSSVGDEAERFFEELRQAAEAALFGRGDLAAAVAVYDAAAPRVLTAKGRARLDVERARMRLAAPDGAAGADGAGVAAEAEGAYRGVAEAWTADVLGEVGRPWILLATAAAGRGVARAKGDLARAERDGVLDRAALFPTERDHARRAVAMEPPPSDLVRVSSLVAGGARLELSVPASFLWDDLASTVPEAMSRGGPQGDRPGSVEVTVGPVDEDGPFASHSYRAGVERSRVVLAPALEGREAWIRLVHREADAWVDQWRTRRAWTFAGIGALLVTVVFGVALVRRALLRERAALRLRDDFVANVSHELRTPLTSVCLHAEMLAEDDVPGDRRRAHAGVVRAEGARLMALVEEMLDFAALERGARRLEPEPLDLGAAVRRAAEPYVVLAEREGVTLSVHVPPEGPLAFADRAAVARILANLVANAWKHGRPSRDGAPGRITLVAEDAPEGPRVLVADDGPGIPEGDLPHLFERFRRGAGTGARPGVGLGLAIARDLARQSGGDLQYAGNGHGASFRLALPRPPEDRP